MNKVESLNHYEQLGLISMIYENLRNIREEKGYTQTDVADILNISRQQYQLYESGKRDIPIKFVKKLASIYKVSADYLLECTDDLQESADVESDLDEYSFRKLTERLADAYEEAEKLNENYKRIQTKFNKEASKLLLNSPSSIEWLLTQYKRNILKYTTELENLLFMSTK